MTASGKKNLNEMLGRLKSAPSKEEARLRQMAVWKNESVDRLPITFDILTGIDGPRYNYEERYYDKEKMLFESLYSLIGVAESPSDAIPSMRADMGTGALATIFGVEQIIFPDKDPWIKVRLTKKQISNLETDSFLDMSNAGIMPKVLDYQRYFQRMLDSAAGVFLADTQGPFDIAYLVRGDDIYTDMYDDPPFVHHLMELATAVYIAATKLMKIDLHEPFDEGYHSNGVYLANGGVNICEDSPVILSPRLIDEFVAPYTEKALAPFGGGFVHYCGRNDHLFRTLAEMPHVRGFNFGMPERQDMELVMNTLLSRGKVYYGEWSRDEGEGLRDYFSRIVRSLDGAKKGLILMPFLRGDEIRNPQAVMDFWIEAQNRP